MADESQMIEQKLIMLSAFGGGLHAFFYSPGSIGSLYAHMKEGWHLKFYEKNSNGIDAWVVLERTLVPVQFDQARASGAV